ncbi:hypothetical protein [Actinoplanes sp. M2I2]|uniref:hypothetical protein n=1 Tax=Actinoplanes sp. M2I2 TaxID=1734444 RepID=UPI0020205233|nr:hypothetical protein [Actinoplanes sp. M2I2]
MLRILALLAAVASSCAVPMTAVTFVQGIYERGDFHWSLLLSSLFYVAVTAALVAYLKSPMKERKLLDRHSCWHCNGTGRTRVPIGGGSAGGVAMVEHACCYCR